MRYAQILIGLIAVAFAATSSAAQKEVQYTGPPKWVIPVPTPTDSQTPDGASYRVVHSDNQVHFGPTGVEAFQAYRVIDVLKSTKFQPVQREGFLERAALSGEMTAVHQVPGLQIDDELEVAVTVQHKDPTIGGIVSRR